MENILYWQKLPEHIPLTNQFHFAIRFNFDFSFRLNFWFAFFRPPSHTAIAAAKKWNWTENSEDAYEEHFGEVYSVQMYLIFSSSLELKVRKKKKRKAICYLATFTLMSSTVSFFALSKIIFMSFIFYLYILNVMNANYMQWLSQRAKRNHEIYLKSIDSSIFDISKTKRKKILYTVHSTHPKYWTRLTVLFCLFEPRSICYSHPVFYFFSIFFFRSHFLFWFSFSLFFLSTIFPLMWECWCWCWTFKCFLRLLKWIMYARYDIYIHLITNIIITFDWLNANQKSGTNNEQNLFIGPSSMLFSDTVYYTELQFNDIATSFNELNFIPHWTQNNLTKNTV